MRQIKFRGKYIHGENWIEGDLMHSNGDIYIFPEDAPNSTDNYQVDPETVQQLTPFLDRNGNQIWEGDSLLGFSEFPSSYEVFFFDGGFKLRYKMTDGSYYDWGPLHRIFEVKGMFAEVITTPKTRA